MFRYGPTATAAESAPPGADCTRTGTNAPAAELAAACASGPAVALAVVRLATAPARVMGRFSVLESAPRNAVATVRWASPVWAIAACCLALTSRSMISFCNTMPSTNTTAVDRARVLMTTRTCNDRRHSSPNTTHRRPASAATRRAVRTTRLTTVATSFTSSRSCSRRAGLVTDAADGQDDLGVLRVALHLGPQALHVHVDQPGVRG